MSQRVHRRGFTLIELLVTICMVGILVAILVPRLRTSQRQLVYEAARQVGYDLEAVRGRSMSTASGAEVVFNTGTNSYNGYLDTNQDGVFAQSAAEQTALQLFGYRALASTVKFGIGSATQINTTQYPGTPPITMASNTAVFDSRGLMTPVGATGAIYIVSNADPTAVAAVTITAASNVRIWRWQGGTWN